MTEITIDQQLFDDIDYVVDTVNYLDPYAGMSLIDDPAEMEDDVELV